MMKLLIVGIDGGDEGIFAHFDMPFLRDLLQHGVTQRLTQHPFERGWVSMLTGRPAAETRGLFMQRVSERKPELQFRCTMADMLSNPEVTPLWRVALDSGYRVGFMNVPTTYPAPDVDGFFVSGAGGGLNKVDGIPDAMVKPASAKDVLARHGYVIDYRFGSEPIRDMDLLFDRVNGMMTRRTAAFVDLCRLHEIDMGFVAYRATTVVQYMAMSELTGLMNCGNTPTPIWGGKLRQHYRLVDDALRELFDNLRPDHWLIVSDHGSSPYLHHGNLDVFLIRNGYMQPAAWGRRTILRLLRSSLRERTLDPDKLGRHVPLRGRREGASAFGNWYLPGIYANDEERFGGPVAQADIAPLVDEICARFNAGCDALRYGMCARPYRRLYEGAPFYDDLADIWVDAPDTIFFDGSGRRVISENDDFAPLPNLDTVRGGMHSGQKRRRPLFLSDKGLAELVLVDDPTDLRLVHRVAERVLSRQP
jgi:predicted AlkP superfamily phosphohydrolase/phosphomutase